MTTRTQQLMFGQTRCRRLTASLQFLCLTWFWGACLWGVCFWGICLTRVSAQDSQPARKPSPQSAGPHFFVPLEQLQTLIQQDHKWVLLTQDEFKRLQTDAERGANQPQPPTAVGVQNVQYAAKIVGDQLVLNATMQISKFAPGWQTLPLEFTELSLEKATLDDQPARLGRDPQAEGRLTLLLDQPGTRTLTLELSRPLVAVGSDKLAAFGLPRHTGIELTLDLAAEKHLQWNGLAVERPAPNDQPAQFKLALGGQKQVELKITDRPTQQTSEGLVFAQTAIGIRAAPEEITWQAVTALQVFGKPLDQLQFRVPETLEIISITSPGLESWEFGPNGPVNGETTLDLRYRQPFQEPREITVQGVMAAKTGESWLVPGLKLANVASHTADIVVTTAPGMRLQAEEAVGVQRATIAETETPPVPGGVRFTAWREDFVLRFNTLPKAREISAAIVTLLDINSSGLNLKSNVTLETRFAPLFEVLMSLPAEWTVTDALVNQERVSWETIPQEAGIHQLRIPLKTLLSPGHHAVIQLQAHRDPEGWPIETGKTAISLPEVRLVQSNVVEGTVLVAAEMDLDVEAGQLKGLSPAQLDHTVTARLAYEYQDTHYSGEIQVSRKPSRISARTLAFHRLDKETLLSHLESRLEVQGGGTRRLLLSLPESAGTNLRFELSECGARIVEQTVAEPADGRRVWTLLLDQRTRGNLLVLVDISQPRERATEFTPPTLRVLGVERETGAIAFEAEPDQQLDVTAKDANDATLADVDPADLPVPTAYLPKDRIVAAYGYVLPGYQLKLSERRFERLAVPTAICDQLKLVSILGETGEFQHEATFRLRAVGVQSLQVQLPEGALLWATLLDENPIEVRHTDKSYLIPLASTSGTATAATDDANRTRTLKLFYRTDAGELVAAAKLTQTPPSITVLNGDGTVQPLEILQQDWVVHHPEQIEFVSSPGLFQTDKVSSIPSLLGGLLNQFAVDAPGKLLWKLVALLVVVGVVWVIRSVVSHSGYRGLVALTFLIGIGLVFLGLATFPGSEKKSAQFAAGSANFSTLYKSPAATMSPPVAAASEDRVEEMDQLQELTTSEAILDDAQALHRFGNVTPPMADSKKFDGPSGPDRGLIRRGDYPKLGTIVGMERPENFKLDSTTRATPPARSPTLSTQSGTVQNRRYEESRAKELAQNAERKDSEPQAEVPQSEAAPAEEKPAEQPTPVIQPPGAPPPDVEIQLANPNQPAMPAENEFEGENGRPNLPQINLSHTKAVYSLALHLEIPDHSTETRFSYRGSGGNAPAELVITYQNRAKLSFVTLVLQMLVVLLCWLARNRSLAFRVLVLTLGFSIPLALVTIVPANWIPILDGLFFGALWGTCVLIIHGIGLWLSNNELSPARVWRLLNTNLTTHAPMLLAISLGLFGSVVDSQELQAQEQQAVPSDGPMQAPRNSPANGVGPAGTLIVPLTVDLDPDQAERVFLPYDKFLELWRQGHPNEPRTTPKVASPFPGLISESLFAAELIPANAEAKSTIKVQGRFVCYSLREGQITLPLPIGKVAVISAKLDGETAPLILGTDASPLAIVISTTGAHVVDVEFSVPVEMTGPAGKFTLPLGAVPTGILRFAAPAADLAYRVNGGSGAFRRIKNGDTESVLVPISNGGDVLVSWRPQQSRGDVEAIIHVDSTMALRVMDDGTRLLSHWNFQVRQGSMSEILFGLPPKLGVRKIEGADVGGWEVAGAGNQKQLKIFLRRKVEDTTQIKFDLFVKQKADDLETLYDVPQFAPLNVTRETGTLAVLADKQFGIRVTTINGLSQIEPQLVPLQRIGEEFTGINVLSYRFASRPYQLEIVAKRRQPQVKVSARHHGHVDPRKIQLLGRYQFNILGAPRSNLALLLPQGYLLQDVQAADASDWHVSGREDSAQMDAEAQLFLEFPAPRTGLVEVVLIGKALRQPENMKAIVDLPYPLEVDDVVSQLLVTLDPIYSAQVGSLDNWKSIDASALSQQLLGREVTTGQFGFSSNTQAPAAIELDLQQQVPQLSADVVTLLTVEEESLDYLFAMQWKIESAGANTFVFTTPDSLAGKLDFPDGNGPRRRSIIQEAIGNGRTRWTVTLEDAQRERYFLIARTVSPPSVSGQVVVPNFVFEQQLPGQVPPQIERLETQSQFVVLVNQSQTQLTSAVPDSVETIAPEDLLRIIKLRPDLMHQAAEIVQVKTPLTPVVWNQQRFLAERTLPASVNLAHHVTVLAADGSWREQVNYRIRNRTRQFLAVRLPGDSQVLSLFVKGQAARPVQSSKDAAITLIPLPKTTEGDVSFEVQLVLAGQLTSGPLPRDWAVFRRQLEIPVPAIVGPEESPEYGIPVSQSTWTVYAPKDLDVDLIKHPDSTNVHAVTETLQSYDQTTALLSDVSELISVNSSTFNRRAKAQSLNNLKQLNEQLSTVAQIKAGGELNSAETSKQQEIEQRVTKLQGSIDKLLLSNSAAGLTVTNDGAGNTIVIDQQAGQGGQSFRFRELYEDNGGQINATADPFSNDFAPLNHTTKAPLESDSAKSLSPSKKGNLHRGELRDLNFSQAVELSNERQRTAGEQEQIDGISTTRSQSRAYIFQNDSAQQGGPGSSTGVLGGMGMRSSGGGSLVSGIQPGPGEGRGSQRFNVPGGGGMGGGGFAPQGGPRGNAGLPVGGQPAQGGINVGDNIAGPGADNQFATPAWSSTGGLSLLIEIPIDGQKLSFSKIGGEPRLALGVRPHQTLQLVLGFGWTIVWSIILIVLIATLRSSRAVEFLLRRTPWLIAGLGLILYFMVPSQVTWGVSGLVAFTIASLWIAFQRPQTAN